MRFSLIVGEAEKHIVDFKFNQLLGRLTIKVDDRVVKRGVRWFSEPLFEEYHHDIMGHRECVSVKIEKERRLLFASKYRVYVQNRLTDVFQGV